MCNNIGLQISLYWCCAEKYQSNHDFELWRCIHFRSCHCSMLEAELKFVDNNTNGCFSRCILVTLLLSYLLVTARVIKLVDTLHQNWGNVNYIVHPRYLTALHVNTVNSFRIWYFNYIYHMNWHLTCLLNMQTLFWIERFVYKMPMVPSCRYREEAGPTSSSFYTWNVDKFDDLGPFLEWHFMVILGHKTRIWCLGL